MNHILRYTILAFLAFLSACITEEPTGRELAVGDPLPSFSVMMNNGESMSNGHLKGKVSMIVFFNTTCPDCRKELPVLQRFHENHPQVPLICISREEIAAPIASYWEQESFTMPYSAQEDRTVYQLFAKQGIPRIYIVGPDGIIRKIFTDQPLPTYEELTEAINILASNNKKDYPTLQINQNYPKHP